MTITTTNDLVAPILQSLAPGMLAVPTPDFIYRIPADRDTMPRQGGTTMRFLRPRPLTPPIVALGNSGIEPPPQVPQRDIKDAVMSFYSTSVILNEQVVLQDQDAVLSWVMERLGVAGYQAEDIILRDYLLSAAGVYNSRGGTNGDNPSNISVRDISNVNSVLSTNNAFKFLNGKLGEDRFGSSPIRAAYILLASTELQADLDGLPDLGLSQFRECM
jgi:N4-gp56 family major capsid protein